MAMIGLTPDDVAARAVLEGGLIRSSLKTEDDHLDVGAFFPADRGM
jgi:hypothetical protein